MTIKLFMIVLLCAAVLADGAWVLLGTSKPPPSVDFFTHLYQTYPDFVIIAYEGRDHYNQSYQNAVTAGYKSIHLTLHAYTYDFSREDTPANFTGRLWLTRNSRSYPDLVTFVENYANQGFNVGIMDPVIVSMSAVVPSIVSSLPFAWIDEQEYGPWEPFAGWYCPSMNVKYVGSDVKHISAIFSCTVNVDCF